MSIRSRLVRYYCTSDDFFHDGMLLFLWHTLNEQPNYLYGSKMDRREVGLMLLIKRYFFLSLCYRLQFQSLFITQGNPFQRHLLALGITILWFASEGLFASKERDQMITHWFVLKFHLRRWVSLRHKRTSRSLKKTNLVFPMPWGEISILYLRKRRSAMLLEKLCAVQTSIEVEQTWKSLSTSTFFYVTLV